MTNTPQVMDPLNNPELRTIIDHIIDESIDLDGGLMVVLIICNRSSAIFLNRCKLMSPKDSAFP